MWWSQLGLADAVLLLFVIIITLFTYCRVLAADLGVWPCEHLIILYYSLLPFYFLHFYNGH